MLGLDEPESETYRGEYGTHPYSWPMTPSQRGGQILRSGTSRVRNFDHDLSEDYDPLMKPSDDRAIHREDIHAIVAHCGGVSLRVFGSVARR